MKRLFFVAFIIAIMGGCTSMQHVTSVPYSDDAISSFKYYDSDNEINYKVLNTSENLYIILNTTNRSSIMKIMSGGLDIYFDVNGKKKKDVYVQYPVQPEKDQRPSMPAGMNGQQGMHHMGFKVPQKAIYNYFDDKYTFDPTKPDADIKVELKMDKGNYLNYVLIVPLSKISSEKIDNLSIGIVSGKMDSQQSGGNGPGGGHPGGGGGTPPSGGGNGPGGGGQMGGNPPDAGGSASSSQIKIWLDVELN